MYGDTLFLTRPEQNLLEGLSRKKVKNKEVTSSEITKVLTGLVAKYRRKLGVFVDRRGNVEWVIVGDAHKLYLPDIGRARGAADRLRGLRLVVVVPAKNDSAGHTELLQKEFEVHQEFIIDLEKLRLDMVLQVEALSNGLPGKAALAVVDAKKRHRVEYFNDYHELDVNIVELLEGVESELARSSEVSRQKNIRHEKDRAMLVGVYTTSKKTWQPSIDELKELTKSAGVSIAATVTQQRSKLDPKTIVGKGKLEDICLQALHEGAEVLIFDCDLSPSQLNAITDLTDLKVLDRTMLILDIFAQRATTTEGKLQVELAQLRYSQPRLQKKQSGLSRLAGGIGGRGPGETKLQVDKRRVRDRISRLEKEVIKVSNQRRMRRKRRIERDVPIIAIVGYTNAGKSTLLNALTKSEIYAKNELFATLDPTSRRLRFPKEHEVIISDTVGFIRDLPKGLVASFEATLEELVEADLLLHVVDVSDSDYLRHIEAVNKVLKDINLHEIKRLLVFNKCDAIDERMAKLRAKQLEATAISAIRHEGLEELLERAEAMIF